VAKVMAQTMGRSPRHRNWYLLLYLL
jgi:hypothetical protein